MTHGKVSTGHIFALFVLVLCVCVCVCVCVIILIPACDLPSCSSAHQNTRLEPSSKPKPLTTIIHHSERTTHPAHAHRERLFELFCADGSVRVCAKHAQIAPKPDFELTGTPGWLAIMLAF